MPGATAPNPPVLSKPVRVALIGAGGIAGEHVNGFIRHADKIVCVAMADIAPDNLRRRIDQYGRPGVRAYADWNRMLGDMGGEIDAVDICLPHHLHAPCILSAVEAGKHVLCEKPMCNTLEEADRIASALRSRPGVVYMSAHNQLFLPSVREARRLLDAGAVGRPFLVRSQDCFHANWGPGGDPFGGTWRASLRTQGGGVLIDTGYHPAYRLLHLAPRGARVSAVRAAMARFRQRIEGEDSAAVVVRFDDGTLGEILTSWAFANPFGTHQVHVVGERGQLFGSGDTLYHLPAGAVEPEKMQLPPVNTFEAQLGHFADCLLTGARPLHGFAEARAVLALILAATRSAEGWQGEWPGSAVQVTHASQPR